MRAAQINEYGDSDVLKMVTDAPKPKPMAGQVLVEVYAAAVNPFDAKVRAGYTKDTIQLKFPATLGGDLAGVVTELGEAVNDFVVGDEVFGQANAVSGTGSYAEFAPVQAESLAVKPVSLDFITSAAVPLAASSAYQALVDHAELKSGQKVLVHGGAGGIGSFAVQVAKYLGAHVVSTASTEDIDYVKQLGADEVIDYKTQDFATTSKDYDVVFDTVGGETFTKSHSVLKPSGVIVTMAGQPDEALANKHNIRVIHQSSKVTTNRLNQLSELLEQGVLKVHVDKTFALENAGEAQDYLQAGSHRGKIVLKVK